MLILGFNRGCGEDCVEDFEYLMALTGWSQTTLMVVFFSAIFLLLIALVLLIHKLK